MSTDPFVVERLAGRPRQRQNLAPGVSLPPGRAWEPDRPGELPAGQPTGELLGTPGPNIGYALGLAHRVEDRLALAPHEHAQDALAVVAVVAMRRAAAFGRAPVSGDVEFAMNVLGYQGGCEPEFAEWRSGAIAGCDHDYARRQRFAAQIDPEVVRLIPSALGRRVSGVRAGLRAALA
ncbi:MAG: hypothetical protein L3K06_03615 [Thermoplasmata archaeon]|nr:hypothetical protein [Thermoplasmata archaeon]